jgi:hypothetical protein
MIHARYGDQWPETVERAGRDAIADSFILI